jgi:hypothetical protein
MNQLQIETEFDAFYPGSDAPVTLEWTLPEPPEAIELRLVWNTSGKGDRDLQVVQTHRFENPPAAGRQVATIQFPWGPYSFSGKLISLIWALELVVLPTGESIRKEITIGPNALEVLIGAARKENSSDPPNEF